MKRSDAEQMIEDCGIGDKTRRLALLQALSVEWIGHEQEGLAADDIEGLLYEYIDECAVDSREHGPQPDDEIAIGDDAEVHIEAMTAPEFLKAFPEVLRDQSTGGGCTAWEVRLPNDAYVLITDGQDACQASLASRRAMFGVGYDCCDYDIACHTLTWAEGARWLRGVLDGAAIVAAANRKA